MARGPGRLLPPDAQMVELFSSLYYFILRRPARGSWEPKNGAGVS